MGINWSGERDADPVTRYAVARAGQLFERHLASVADPSGCRNDEAIWASLAEHSEAGIQVVQSVLDQQRAALLDVARALATRVKMPNHHELRLPDCPDPSCIAEIVAEKWSGQLPDALRRQLPKTHTQFLEIG